MSNYIHRTPWLGPLVTDIGVGTGDLSKNPGQVSGYAPLRPTSSTTSSLDAVSDVIIEDSVFPQNDLAREGLITDPNQISEKRIGQRIISAVTNLEHRITKMADGTYSLSARRGQTALYSALNYLRTDTRWETILIGWPGEIEQELSLCLDFSFDSDNTDYELSSKEKASLEAEYTRLNKGATVKPIWLPGDPQAYRAYAENTIWPILHYIQGDPTDGKQESHWWKDYVKFNEAYRDMILDVYRKGDIIWIHDYYLFLLPQMLRMKIPDAHIGMFMHGPFPSSEYFRCIPQRNELLEGILGSNLVGTQSQAYSRHFISSCTRLLGVESSPDHISAYGVFVTVQALQIGIDTVTVEKDAFHPKIDEKVKAIRALYPDKKIIVGRDRLDSVRGVVQKLQAFEMFLETYPEWKERVVLIQVTSPAFSSSTKVEKKVSELVSHINGTYGMLHFAPVHHYPRHIARDEYLALLRVADLGLITSVRDGMNTTSLEYVVCQKKNNSPLILSEFTGTAGSLLDAIQVNPWDALEVADTIHQCLLSKELNPKENRERQEKLYKHVTTRTVQDWVKRFITTLVSTIERHEYSHVTPVLDSSKLLETYNKAKQRLFLFDYDGTLTPIVKEPSAAIPSSRLRDVLTKLCADDRNIVWIISGRDQQFLDRWLGQVSSRIGFSAEHGCFIKYPHSDEWQNLIEKVDMSWQKVVEEIFSYYTDRTQGSNIERKKAALTWHYRRADPDYGSYQARSLRDHLEQTVANQFDVEVMAGKANVEVRPRQFNKGEIVKQIVRELDHQPNFIICLGDDATDEDMFQALQELDDLDGIFPVTVGPPSKMTVASWHLLDPNAVLDTLCLLTESEA